MCAQRLDLAGGELQLSPEPRGVVAIAIVIVTGAASTRTGGGERAEAAPILGVALGLVGTSTLGQDFAPQAMTCSAVSKNQRERFEKTQKREGGGIGIERECMSAPRKQ